MATGIETSSTEVDVGISEPGPAWRHPIPEALNRSTGRSRKIKDIKFDIKQVISLGVGISCHP